MFHPPFLLPASSRTISSTSHPTTMRAAVVRGPGEIEICEVPLRVPGPREVRIRIESCGVCASNLPPWEGRPWFSYPMAPGALGHEATGVIDRVGSEVCGWQPGIRVAFLSDHAYAEYDFAEADALVALAPGSAAWPGEPLGCALNVFRRSGIGAGMSVAVVGVGFMGALLIQMAHQAGARVIALARRPYARAIARSLGAATLPLNGNHETMVRRVEKLAGGCLPEVVIEATGEQGPLEIAAELTRARGRLVVAGYHQDGLRWINMQLWNWRGFDVVNAHEREARTYVEGMEAALRAVAAGQLDPAPLITHRFPLEELGTALRLIRERPPGFLKAVITL